MSDTNPFEAVVVAIPDNEGFIDGRGMGAADTWKAVLNVGSTDGISTGNNFIIFTLGRELTDPISGESLGHYEIVRGRARVTHVQERMCTVISDRTIRKLSALNALSSLASPDTYTSEAAPFPYLEVGDFARLIG